MTDKRSEDHFVEGKRHLKDEHIDRALRAFGKAYKGDKKNPYYMSYYGLLKAVRSGEIGLGLELCTMAIKKEFYKSEFYLNLGKVYLAAGNIKGAVNVFKKGLNFEPQNEELNKLLADLGVRKGQVVSVLDRSNPINKFFGIIFRRTIPGLFKKFKA
ncbi:MAG: tetratricopeptide repeat protein [Thermodesulfobacteriota bacterium]|nr:MAG: tetratricopeptide repeat protein [Thermodesulfobacteriota bacterium]